MASHAPSDHDDAPSDRNPCNNPLSRYLIVDNRDLWFDLAGSMPFDPTIDAYVYYYPEGHIESTCQTDDPLHLAGLYVGCGPFFCCKIVSVSLLADWDTEEILARFSLQHAPEPGVGEYADETPVPEVPDTLWFSKDLTRTDLKKGLILPHTATGPGVNYIFMPHPLGTSEEYSITDFRKTTWKIGHLRSRKSGDYSLSKGWKKFVAAKGLIVGDSIVIRKDDEGISIGIWRKKRHSAKAYSKFCQDKNEELNVKGFIVNEALKLAKAKKPFDVLYYPKWGAKFLISPSIRNEAVRELDMLQRMGYKAVRKSVSGITGKLIELDKTNAWKKTTVLWDGETISSSVNAWEILPHETFIAEDQPVTQDQPAEPVDDSNAVQHQPADAS